MNTTWKNRLSLAVVAALVVAGLIAFTRFQPVQGAADDAATAGPRYTVVDTEGSNLLVTDNKTATLYFYTIDKDKEIGSDLKLRGSIDLHQVGKPVITVTKPAASD
jgi:hypothetical protein